MSASRNTKETLFTLAYILLGVAGSVGAGLLTYGGRFLQFPRPAVPFLLVGLAGALIYASAQLRGLGLTLLMAVLFYLSQLALLGSLRGPALAAKLVDAAILTGPVGTALVVSAYLSRALGRIKFGKFALTAVVVAVGYTVMVLLWLVKVRPEQASQSALTQAVLAQAFIGLKIGAGIGLGVELVDLLGGPRPRVGDTFDD
jgi:hypothetical protein